jgi:hypothetical protein
MLEAYSERARQVIFLARLEAGARGAEMIDVGDLLTAIIIEDHGKFRDTSAEFLGSSGTLAGQKSHPAFLPSENAAHLLETLHQTPRSQAIATSTDMQISPALSETLAAASDLKETLQKELTPLHLLAAVLRQSTEGAPLLREIGITEDQIIEAIRRADE